MTENDTDTETDREELWRVQTAVAKANRETADAVQRAAALSDHHHPVMPLTNTQSELQDAYRQVSMALDTVEQTIENAEGDRTTPRSIVADHAERLEEQYDGPVLYLALQLLEYNRREWLHRKPDTNGAEAVRRHGLTGNQRQWLNELQDAWRDYE